MAARSGVIVRAETATSMDPDIRAGMRPSSPLERIWGSNPARLATSDTVRALSPEMTFTATPWLAK